jgi:outer membrane protein, multidrug efflux system
MFNIISKINKKSTFLLIGVLFCFSSISYSQNKKPQNSGSNSVGAPLVVPDTSKVNLLQPVTLQDTSKGGAPQLTLKQCIDYAIIHQPGLNISLINIDVAATNNKINLAGALPQVNASGSLIHYIQTSNNNSSTSSPVSGGPYTNTFIPGVSVSQALFNPSLLYAYKSAPLYITQATQVKDSTKINVVDLVSKSFYNLLLTLEQINVLRGDTAEFGKSLRDAYYQYKGGIVDETDYEQAEITLNNTKAQLKQATENVVPQYATLKQYMGFPPEKQFNVYFDTLEMMKSIHIDTNQQLQYEKRIEFQLLNTDKNLQLQLIDYYHYSWLPTISANFQYNLEFENSQYANLLGTSYPSSYIGLSFSIPIFTGFARLNNLHKAKLQAQILDWNQIDLKSNIYTQYTTALANYKGNYYNLQLLQKNVVLSKRVYFVVELQYKQGLVPYLNVITAQSNLITSEINYINALFQVLSNKVDLQKAMGQISY